MRAAYENARHSLLVKVDRQAERSGGSIRGARHPRRSTGGTYKIDNAGMASTSVEGYAKEVRGGGALPVGQTAVNRAVRGPVLVRRVLFAAGKSSAWRSSSRACRYCSLEILLL